MRDIALAIHQGARRRTDGGVGKDARGEREGEGEGEGEGGGEGSGGGFGGDGEGLTVEQGWRLLAFMCEEACGSKSVRRFLSPPAPPSPAPKPQP